MKVKVKDTYEHEICIQRIQCLRDRVKFVEFAFQEIYAYRMLVTHETNLAIRFSF